MLGKKRESVCSVVIASLLFLVVACSGLHGRLHGEWIVDPEKTVRLEANKDLVQGWEDFQRRLLADTDLRFTFEEDVLTISMHDTRIFRAKYEVKHVSDEEMILHAGRDMRIVFQGEDAAVIESGGKFDQYYLTRKR